MIYQATRFLAELLKSPEVGYGVVFETAADLQAHRTPPYAALIIDQDERYRRVERKVSFEDYPETNRRVYTYEVLRAVLPVSVLLVEKDRQSLEERRRKFLATLPSTMVDNQGSEVRITPTSGEFLEDQSVKRGGVAIDIVVEFDGGIYRMEEVPLFTSVEIEGIDIDRSQVRG
ncbi:MAG: hypothetical protein ACOX44_07895 [Limnochordia bacterium]